jgi:hypothetical protein
MPKIRQHSARGRKVKLLPAGLPTPWQHDHHMRESYLAEFPGHFPDTQNH